MFTVTKMDTLTFQRKIGFRLIANPLSVSIFTGLVFSFLIFQGHPLLAKELTLAHNAIIAPIINNPHIENELQKEVTIEEKKENFNNEIKRKYKSATIIDVEDGVKHIKMTKYYQGKPVKINIIEVNPKINPEITLKPELASESLNKKSTITTIAKKNDSIVAINGTFFKPTTGVPLGTLMIDKKLYTGPIYNRVAMGIFDDRYEMARVQLKANIKSNKALITVDNINQPRMLSTYVIAYTKEWGNIAPPSPKYGIQIAVKDGKIIQQSTSQLRIPQDGFVVVGPQSKLNELINTTNINLDVSTIPDWENVNHIISGGPFLVKNGDVYVDISEQKLAAIGGRNPRSAIGYTADNNLIIVAVDGREESSVGLTLTELAYLMKSIGCINALNLDGGGSTVMYVKGNIVNQPQVKGGIALSNALTLSKSN